MPRFLITICDTATGEIANHISASFVHPSTAIIRHPWLEQTYKDAYVMEMFWAEDEDECKNNIYSKLGWAVSCVNLDELIMKELNGGDSSVSSQTQEK